MNMLPAVLVIIPCYNHGNYVAQAIQSVLSQTYPNIRLVVVNDGSTDDSAEQIDGLAQQYGFHVIHQENKGVSASLNKALSLVPQVDYVATLGADDWWPPEKTANQVAFLETNPTVYLSYGLVQAFAGDKLLDIRGEVHEGQLFSSLLRGNFIPAMTVMLRRKVFDKVGLFDEHLAIEDWDMWLRVCHKYPAAGLNEVLAYYRRHNTNVSNNKLLMATNMILVLAKWKHHATVYAYPLFLLWRVAERILGRSRQHRPIA